MKFLYECYVRNKQAKIKTLKHTEVRQNQISNSIWLFEELNRLNIYDIKRRVQNEHFYR